MAISVPDDVTRQFFRGEEVIAVESASGVPVSGTSIFGGPATPILFTYVLTNARFMDRLVNDAGRPMSTSSWLTAEGLALVPSKRGFVRYELRWQHPVSFEAYVSRVSKDFARALSALVGDRSRWLTPPPETAHWIGENVDWSGDEQAKCSVCGGWLGKVEDNRPEARECGSCLRTVGERV